LEEAEIDESNAMTLASERPPAVWLDHFVVAIRNLDAGIDAFEALAGVTPVYGGEHPGLGTHNALASLGRDRYLEILAPRPGATLDPFISGASECATLTPILWAFATDDIEALHGVVTSAGFAANAPSPGARLTRGGETLRWTILTMSDEGPAGAPFFLQWDAASGHPAASSPPGCSLESYTVTSPRHAWRAWRSPASC